MRVEPISAATHHPALEYLGRLPYLNVFIAHILSHDAVPSLRRNVVVAVDSDGVAGVAYFGRQVAVAAEPRAIAALADSWSLHRGVRMLLGERETVRAFWSIVAKDSAMPRIVRHRQLVMMLDRTRLRPYDRSVEVRYARMDEWRRVAESSASMVEHELDYDPRGGSLDFDVGIRRMIDRKLWWVGVERSRLCFFCNVGPWSEATAQLQGIWTPPELRGRGLATASLAAISDRLLAATPTLSLYVNDFNQPAIALYRRVGFEHVGDFMTILF